MKKLIALVLTIAMLASCFVLSASAETTPEFVAEGPANAAVGDVITVKVRLNDAGKDVGGVQGTITATGATVQSVEVNPDLKTWNDTDDVNTIYTRNAEKTVITFAAVNALKNTDTKYDTRVWFIIKYEVTAANPVIDVEAKAATKNAAAQTITATDLRITTPEASASEPVATLNLSGILPEESALNQGILINATVNIPAESITKVSEFGVVFYPTALLDGEELTYDFEGAAKATIKSSDNDFMTYVNQGNFNAILNFGFTGDDAETKALRFLGTKVTARVYYVMNGTAKYSTNNVDDYIQNGISEKTAINAILDNGDVFADAGYAAGDITVQQYNEAKGAIHTVRDADVWEANRATILEYAVENAPEAE